MAHITHNTGQRVLATMTGATWRHRREPMEGEKPGQRRALLVDAVPEKNLQQGFLLRYVKSPEGRQWENRPRKRRCQLLLPWLSVEVIETNPGTLFSLINKRTAHAPEEWAPYDCRQLTMSWAYGQFDTEYTDKCVVSTVQIW